MRAVRASVGRLGEVRRREVDIERGRSWPAGGSVSEGVEGEDVGESWGTGEVLDGIGSCGLVGVDGVEV